MTQSINAQPGNVPSPGGQIPPLAFQNPHFNSVNAAKGLFSKKTIFSLFENYKSKVKVVKNVE
jgi:hypothetical protein